MPTYKEQRAQIRDKDLGTYGFLGYPVLQAADILMYRADYVPVGEDQVSHIELTREICRRFNNYYGEVFPEPQPLLTKTPRVPGTDGRKMSKSYGNAISLSDPEPVIRKKVSNMITDPARKRRSDPGDPDVCPLFAYHKLFSPKETVEMVNVECRRAGIGCVEDKKLLAGNLVQALAPIQERRRELEKKPNALRDVLADGARKAKVTAGADHGSGADGDEPEGGMVNARRGQGMEQPYSVKLEAYEGPLDLLLDLIRKQEINIYDIPIAHITAQYLEYVQQNLERLNPEAAGESS